MSTIDSRRLPQYNVDTGNVDLTGPTVDEFLGGMAESYREEMLVAAGMFGGQAARVVIRTVASTSAALTDADHGKILDFTNGSASTLTVPAGLRSDFLCGVSQSGAGQVTLSPANGVTLQEPDNQLKTEKRYVMVTLIAMAANVYTVSGRTAA